MYSNNLLGFGGASMGNSTERAFAVIDCRVECLRRRRCRRPLSKMMAVPRADGHWAIGCHGVDSYWLRALDLEQYYCFELCSRRPLINLFTCIILLHAIFYRCGPDRRSVTCFWLQSITRRSKQMQRMEEKWRYLMTEYRIVDMICWTRYLIHVLRPVTIGTTIKPAALEVHLELWAKLQHISIIINENSY